MNPAERNYAIMEREALAVIYACKKFRHYLLGYKVIVHTNHDSLKYLVNKLDLSARLARWIQLLQEFNYEVVVKSGKSNLNIDFLSQQRGPERVIELQTEFLDDFPKAGNVGDILDTERFRNVEDILVFLMDEDNEPELGQI